MIVPALTLYAMWEKAPEEPETPENPETPEEPEPFATTVFAQVRAAVAAASSGAATTASTTSDDALFPPENETDEAAAERIKGYLLELWKPPTGVTGDEAVELALASAVDWISKASLVDLRDMEPKRRVVIFGDPVDKFNNDDIADGVENPGGPDGLQDLKYDAYLGEWVRVHEGNGFAQLSDAYARRIEELNRDATYRWSDVKWVDSLNHNFGLVPVVRQSISGIVWQDTNYNGVRDGDEGERFANVPITLERSRWGTLPDGSEAGSLMRRSTTPSALIR